MPTSRLAPALALTALTLALGGCARGYVTRDYVPPDGADTVAVTYHAVDAFENFDRIKIALVSRPDCSEPPVFEELAVLGSKGLLGREPEYRVQGRLPAGRRLNLYVDNTTTAGLRTDRCQNMQTYVLPPGSDYALRLANWSTPGSTRYGFGCAFDIVALDDTGEPERSLEPVASDLPECGD